MNDKYVGGLIGDKISDDDKSLEFLAGSEQYPNLPTEFFMFGSPIKNQGTCGSCTAHGATTCHEIQNNWEHRQVIILDAYKLWAKQVNKGATCEVGDYISNAIDMIELHGSETKDNKKFRSKGKARIYDKSPYSLKKWLSQGYPLVVGMQWYSSLFDSKGEYTGSKAQGGIGGHCFAIVGYDDKHLNPHLNFPNGAFVCQNSWGESWGDKGRFWIPYQSMSELLFNSIYTIYDMADNSFIKGTKDVRDNAWYSDAINWVLEQGIMSTNQDQMFRPEAQITRAELAQVLFNMNKK